MQPDFWHERWRRGQIGFHRTSIDTFLTRHWDALGLDAEVRVVVPLCGKSLDLLWLQARGHNVVGVELSDVALQAFCLENGVAARRRPGTPFTRYTAERLELWQGDLFALSLDCLGPVAAVFDRASLVAFAPPQQSDYVEKMIALTRPGTQTLLVTFEYPQHQTSGPPFSVSAEDLERLYGATHAIHELERRDILASEPRMQARGVTSLAEGCYRLERL